MSGLAFDADAVRLLERLYTTPDVVLQRARFLQLLRPAAGERILDIGAGPGLLAADLAQSVGENGRIAGVDASEAMVAAARQRCAAWGWADFQVADACALPFGDGEFDAVTATQVYEYVQDMQAALAEVRRVLRPGGRVFILDTCWDSVVWNTRDRARMRRVLDAWENHLHEPNLPARLGALLEGAGLCVCCVEIIPLLNPNLHRHCYSGAMLGAIRSFAARWGIPEAEAAAWADELRELGRRGEYFFSINRTCFGAVRPFPGGAAGHGRKDP